MIYLPQEYAMVLTVVMVVLFLYAFIDHENKRYGYIMASGLAAYIAWMLGLSIIGELVGIAMQGGLLAIQFPGLGIMYIIIAGYMTLYFVSQLVAAYNERFSRAVDTDSGGLDNYDEPDYKAQHNTYIKGDDDGE